MSLKTNEWWEKKLNIRTSGKIDHFLEEKCNPYEPTDYCILEELAESGFITSDSHILDYGCGLGRTLFFLTAKTGCRATGVEFDRALYDGAMLNLERVKMPSKYKEGIRFVHTDARNYQVQDENCFYFFNPFSEDILRIVLEQIKLSYYRNPRRCLLFFYYPYDMAVTMLMLKNGMDYVGEIDCMDLYDLFDSRERILVFGLG